MPLERAELPKFFELLVCPLMKCPLYYDPETHELVSREAGLAYPIRHDIPVLVPDEARLLEARLLEASVLDPL